MAIWGSLTTSTMAMMAHTRHMGQIGNNISNMNTTSFKEVETTYQTQKAHRSQGYDQFSVDTIDVRRVENQGVITGTGRSYDLAINGGGFFVTNTAEDGSGDTTYTRDGGFTGRQATLGEDSDGDGQNDQSTLLVSQQGDYVMGWAANPDGTFGTTLGAVQINHNAVIPGLATSEATLSGNVPNVNGRATASAYQTSLPVVASGTDANGAYTRSHSVTMTWTKTPDAQNSWELDLPATGDVASATVSSPTVLFRKDGSLDTTNGPSVLDITVTWNDGSDPTTLSLDISGMTQFSSSEGLVTEHTQNGYTEGRLLSTSFDTQGVLSGNFSNGATRSLFKLPLATFAAPNKLEALNGNSYKETHESGVPSTVDLASLDGGTTLTPGALETSNVVLEEQFSRMITTQKAYSSSATVFKTSDEMIQEVRNLKR